MQVNLTNTNTADLIEPFKASFRKETEFVLGLARDIGTWPTPTALVKACTGVPKEWRPAAIQWGVDEGFLRCSMTSGGGQVISLAGESLGKRLPVSEALELVFAEYYGVPVGVCAALVNCSTAQVKAAAGRNLEAGVVQMCEAADPPVFTPVDSAGRRVRCRVKPSSLIPSGGIQMATLEQQIKKCCDLMGSIGKAVGRQNIGKRFPGHSKDAVEKAVRRCLASGSVEAIRKSLIAPGVQETGQVYGSFGILALLEKNPGLPVKDYLMTFNYENEIGRTNWHICIQAGFVEIREGKAFPTQKLLDLEWL